MRLLFTQKEDHRQVSLLLSQEYQSVSSGYKSLQVLFRNQKNKMNLRYIWREVKATIRKIINH